MKDLESKLKSKSEAEVDEIVKCPECDSPHLVKDYERGEVVCEKCGLVIDEQIIDPGEPWRTFGPGKEVRGTEKIHAGRVDPLRHDKGLGSEICGDRDERGKFSKAAYRLRKTHERMRVSKPKERSTAQAFIELEGHLSRGGLPKIVHEEACNIYLQVRDSNLLRGRSKDDVIAAIVYAACRRGEVPRTADEIEHITAIPKRNILRTYSDLSKKLNWHLPLSAAEAYVERFCNLLGFTGQEVQTKTYEILKQTTEGKGTTPPGDAAAAIYISSLLCGQRRLQKEVSDATGVTEVTIRNRSKYMADKLELDIKEYRNCRENRLKSIKGIRVDLANKKMENYIT